ADLPDLRNPLRGHARGPGRGVVGAAQRDARKAADGRIDGISRDGQARDAARRAPPADAPPQGCGIARECDVRRRDERLGGECPYGATTPQDAVPSEDVAAAVPGALA